MSCVASGSTESGTRRRGDAKDDVLVIPVGAEDLERWIEADDRVSVLGELHKRAVFATKG